MGSSSSSPVVPTAKSEFFSECYPHLTSKDLIAIRAVFRKYFPERKIYDYSSLEPDMQDAILFSVEEAVEYYLPGILDLMIEIFGDPIPATTTWTHYAASCNSLAFMKRLHELNYELDQINAIGGIHCSTALYTSAILGRVETVKYLLSMGADPTIVTNDDLKRTPLEEAYENDYFEVARLLANPKTLAIPAFKFNDDDDDAVITLLEQARADGNQRYIDLFEEALKHKNK